MCKVDLKMSEIAELSLTMLFSTVFVFVDKQGGILMR